MLRLVKFVVVLLLATTWQATALAKVNLNHQYEPALSPDHFAPEQKAVSPQASVQGGAGSEEFPQQGASVNPQTKEYKYFRISLSNGWTEYFPQKRKNNGEYIVVFNNATGDTALTITTARYDKDLSDYEISVAANKVIKRLEKNDIIFVTAHLDTHQRVFVGAAQHRITEQQWRLILTQQNGVLYTVIFNGEDLDGAARVLNTMQSILN